MTNREDTVYDETFTPEVEAVLKEQIRWLKHHLRTKVGPMAASEVASIKGAFEKNLKRLRHEARERAQKEPK